MSAAEGVDVEEGERLVALEELEAGDVAWMGARVSLELGLELEKLGELGLAALALDDLAEDAGGHFARHLSVTIGMFRWVREEVGNLESQLEDTAITSSGTGRERAAAKAGTYLCQRGVIRCDGRCSS